MALATAIIIFAAAIISIAANIIQLRANLVIMKITMAQPDAIESSMAKPDKINEDRWLMTYLWQKQKGNLFFLLALILIPFLVQFIYSTLSIGILAVLLHCTILFYVILFIVLHTAATEFVTEKRTRIKEIPQTDSDKSADP